MQQVSTCRDVTKQFLECFPGRECRTLVELQTKLARFQRLTGTSYTRCSSVTASTWKKRSQQVIPMEIGYSMLLYKCVHTSVRRNAAIRGRLYTDYNCDSYFRIVYRDKCLQIIRFNMCHNHDLSSNNWQIYPSNRKLSEEQERTLLSILPSCPSYMVIRNYVQTNYGITLTRDDVRSLRKRVACLDQQLVASETTQLTDHNASLPPTSSHLPAFPDTDSNAAGSENHSLTVGSAVSSAKDRRDTAAQLTFEIFHALIRLDSTCFTRYHALFKQTLEHMLEEFPPEKFAPETPKVGTTFPDHAQTGTGSASNSSADETVFVVQNYKPILPKPPPGIKCIPPNSSRRPVKRSSWLAVASNTITASTKRRRKSPLPKHSDKMLGFDRTVEMVGVIPQLLLTVFSLVNVNLMQSLLCGRIVRGPLNLITRTNANRAVVTHIKRKTYPRMYPVTVALPNGASIRIRYAEPRYLLQIPLNLDECSPEERQRRLLRRTPRARLALQEEIEDTFDRSAYEFLLK